MGLGEDCFLNAAGHRCVSMSASACLVRYASLGVEYFFLNVLLVKRSELISSRKFESNMEQAGIQVQ